MQFFKTLHSQFRRSGGKNTRSGRSREISCVVIALVVGGDTVLGQMPEYRSSLNYETTELMSVEARARQFVRDLALAVGRTFHHDGVAFSAGTGLTFDAHPIDFYSGSRLGVVRVTTAPSKEAAHICLLALAMQAGSSANDVARLFVAPDNPGEAPVRAKRLLEKKLLALEDFAARNPGYGGWIPWVDQGDPYLDYQWTTGLQAGNDPDHPSGTWRNRLPALDNGQFGFALMQVEGVARVTGEIVLADRLNHYVSRLKTTSSRIFVDRKGPCSRRSATLRQHKGARCSWSSHSE